MKKLVLIVAAFLGLSAGSASATCTGPAVMHDFPGTAFNMSLATAPDGNCASNNAITTWGGISLGAPSNYGTSPGAVAVIGVNAFVTNFPATQPVSGTFWQATQPVSGTFWQATQPVSAASGAVNAGAYAAGALVAGALVDGASVTEGTKADSACASSSTSCTISSLLHGLLGAAQGANPVNVNGTVTAQTGLTPGVAQTGTIIAANQDLTSVGGKAVPKGGVPVINGGSTYNTVAASQTAQALTGGGGGATGDYLSHCVIQPTTTAAGTVTILDNSTTIFTFTTGTLSNLVPFAVPVGANSTSGAWKITTGANETVTCVGKFT